MRETYEFIVPIILDSGLTLQFSLGFISGSDVVGSVRFKELYERIERSVTLVRNPFL